MSGFPIRTALGQVGEGWKVANATLTNERVAIGGDDSVRESGMIGRIASTWRERPEVRSAALHDELMTGSGSNRKSCGSPEFVSDRQLAVGATGPESAGLKLVFARLAQSISGLEVEVHGEAGLRYERLDDDSPGRRRLHRAVNPGYRYLRAKGNSIEGGTSEILRNVVAERVLGLPTEPRVDKDIAWKDVPR